MVNLNFHLDEIQNCPEDGPLEMPVGMVLLRLRGYDQPTANKGETEQSASMLCSLLLDAGSNVTSCFMLLML